MTFADLDLKDTYDSDEDDILEDFYIPVLSNATKYDRLAGYFSSASFAASAKGMAKFIKNGGRMRLVTSVRISEDDRTAMERGVKNPDDVISEMMQRKLDEADQIQKNYVSALAWLVASGRLEIKIAIPLDHNGEYDTEKLDTSSIYHQKVGILHDAERNIVSFSGSVNETSKAWNSNIEEFKVFCSWKPGQDTYAAMDARKFEKFWFGKSRNTKVIELPEAFKERLLRSAPESEADAIERISGTPPSPDLREYQQDAVDRWIANGRRGILAMATGTGKTRTAISCIRKVYEESAGNLVVVTCPYKHLVTQWIDELKASGIDPRQICSSLESNVPGIARNVRYLDNNIINNLVIVVPYPTFASERFTEMIRSSKSTPFLVADEVHNIGSRGRSKGLLGEYQLRLGLSATPERYFDDRGTKRILDYFEGVVYEFDLDSAIKAGYLAQYSLYPHIVYMTDDESEQYHGYSMQIAIEGSKKSPNLERIQDLSMMRANIRKTASNKSTKFREILEDMQSSDASMDHCLVYCNDGEQLKIMAKILHDKHVMFHRFTDDETDPNYRKKLLQEFEEGTKNVLLAIKCLDEGIDVPSTRTAIILASSGNPREFIQRRGRILRPHAGKTRAVIHDLIVVPKDLPEGETYSKSEVSLIRSELDRLSEFVRSSDNPEVGEAMIITLMKRYKISTKDGKDQD